MRRGLGKGKLPCGAKKGDWEYRPSRKAPAKYAGPKRGKSILYECGKEGKKAIRGG